jgi:hypothetical protein
MNAAITPTFRLGDSRRAPDVEALASRVEPCDAGFSTRRANEIEQEADGGRLPGVR